MRDDIKVIGIIIINNHDNDTNSYANDDYGSSCCFRSRYNRVGNEGGQRGAASVNSGLKLAASREMCVIAMSHSELVATHSCPEPSLFSALPCYDDPRLTSTVLSSSSSFLSFVIYPSLSFKILDLH